MSGQNPREIAIDLLLQRNQGVFIEDALEAALTRFQLSAADRRLCQELAYGTARWQPTLDWLIARKTQHPAQKLLLQNLLRLGLYQIFWLDRIPDHAAVNESVEIAKRRGLKSQAGFINAVLRGFLRDYDLTRAALDALKISDPALGHGHPEWLFNRWQTVWGQENAIRLMNWNNLPPSTFARVNTLKVTPAKLLETWRDEGVEYDFTRQDWIDENVMFRLKAHPPLAHLESFRQGMFYIQDPSTLLAVRELDPRRGEAILDMCAAPGGKLTFIAQIVNNDAKIVAQDILPERLELIRENCLRLGITAARAMLPGKSEVLDEGGYDRILLDAPCSNTGVIRRRVDLRWRIKEQEIARLQGLQLELLRRGASLLKPGRELVYSTCSLEPEENDPVLQTFLKEQPAFLLSSRRQLLPWVDGVDGAFVARLSRR